MDWLSEVELTPDAVVGPPDPAFPELCREVVIPVDDRLTSAVLRRGTGLVVAPGCAVGIAAKRWLSLWARSDTARACERLVTGSVEPPSWSAISVAPEAMARSIVPMHLTRRRGR